MIVKGSNDRNYKSDYDQHAMDLVEKKVEITPIFDPLVDRSTSSIILLRCKVKISRVKID